MEFCEYHRHILYLILYYFQLLQRSWEQNCTWSEPVLSHMSGHCNIADTSYYQYIFCQLFILHYQYLCQSFIPIVITGFISIYIHCMTQESTRFFSDPKGNNKEKQTLTGNSTENLHKSGPQKLITLRIHPFSAWKSLRTKNFIANFGIKTECYENIYCRKKIPDLWI